MKNLKKTLAVLIAIVCAIGAFTIVSADTESSATHPAPEIVRVASLKGPTTMGLVQLMNSAEAETAALPYEFTLAGAADEVVPRLAKGEMDIALVPANLASILYNNTQGAVTVVAINTLGVLYVVETGEAIQSIEDLKGQTLYSTGKGTTPEYALNYVLSKNGIDPAADLTIEYKSEATEVAAALAGGTVSVAMLPQPFVTAAMAQNDQLRVALSLTEAWDAVGDGSALVTGVVVVRTAFLEEYPEAVANFLTEYNQSVQFVNENPDESGQWIADLGIVAKAELAAKAIPACNIVCITGEDMKEKLSGYLEALHAQNPEAVGGNLPDDAFYYIEQPSEN